MPLYNASKIYESSLFLALNTNIKGDLLVMTELCPFSVEIHAHLLSVYYVSNPRETVKITLDLYRLTIQ